MSFKDQFAADTSVFLNAGEFADQVTFTEAGVGVTVNALHNEVVAENEQVMAIYFSIATADIPNITNASTITFNNTTYGVISWRDNAGITDVLVQEVM